MKFFLLLAFVVFRFSLISGDVAGLESVPDLEKAMYLDVESFPCVRLLNLSGGIGCSNPGSEKITAPVLRFENGTHQISHPAAILLPIEQMNDFFLRLSHDNVLSNNVAGVLVESDDLDQQISGFSPDEKFPQAFFAPYNNLTYTWNIAGSGIMWKGYNFPVFLLSKKSTLIVREFAKRNAQSNGSGQTHVAEFNLVMHTTRLGTGDSKSCLEQQTCLPLGGQSVWSSLPPVNTSSTEEQKPIVMAMASQDSSSFFRDRSWGADSSISGLIALLSAVDALSNLDKLNKLRKQLIFVIFTGESWGYLGSRRFLQELDMGTDALKGLNMSRIEQVLEIGSVGKANAKDRILFHAHVGGDTSITKSMLSALETASDSLGSDNIKFEHAASSNPGIPPSSFMEFLRKNSTIPGVVLEDFDSSFSNNFYHSHLDTSANINSTSIAAAAVLVARSLYILASAESSPDVMVLNTIKVNVSLVEELIQCLLTCNPGMSCGIVKRFISPSNNCPGHYVGVYLDAPSGTQHPVNADDTSRLVWNFLADRTSSSGSNSSCTGDCSNQGEICVGAEVEGGGRCVISTTRYVPAYSTRLVFEDNKWRVLPANTSTDPLGFVDPVWTESYWNTLGLRVYAVQSTSSDVLVFLGGAAVTLVSYLAVVFGKTSLLKAMKRD